MVYLINLISSILLSSQKTSLGFQPSIKTAGQRQADLGRDVRGVRLPQRQVQVDLLGGGQAGQDGVVQGEGGDDGEGPG